MDDPQATLDTRGLQDADAADLVQEVLRSVARSLACFNPQKGRVRSWLMAVVRHRLSEFRANQGRQVPASDSHVFCGTPTTKETGVV